jgi:hypothetical protein
VSWRAKVTHFVVVVVVAAAATTIYLSADEAIVATVQFDEYANISQLNFGRELATERLIGW